MITLLSDFGLQDASVAIAKGILMQHTHHLPVVDISHEVQPYLAGQAAYLLAAAYKNFPAGTCHVILFDVLSESLHRLILSEYDGHYFLSSDNGLVPLALGAVPALAWQCIELPPAGTFHDWLHEAGRVIDRLQTRKPADLGLPAYLPKAAPPPPQPVSGADGITCHIIHIDHYDNVVLNITEQQLQALGAGTQFRLQFLGVEEITEISNNYNDVRDGYKLCRFNSNGYLEICINRGKAASLFGLRLGSKFNDIKIFIE